MIVVDNLILVDEIVIKEEDITVADRGKEKEKIIIGCSNYCNHSGSVGIISSLNSSFIFMMFISLQKE